jgi:hypothetical protein
MTIECYYSDCPHHSFHDGEDDGPFCYESKCLATEQEIKIYAEKRYGIDTRNTPPEVKTEG